MANKTVAARLDEATAARLRAVASVENRSSSQVQAVALRLMLDMSPGARRALFAIDGIADAAERQFAAKCIGRSALISYEQIIDARVTEHRAAATRLLDTEEAIETEAVRLCRA